MCSLCDIGMYQKCNACGSGLKTSTTGSKEMSECFGNVYHIYRACREKWQEAEHELKYD